MRFGFWACCMVPWAGEVSSSTSLGLLEGEMSSLKFLIIWGSYVGNKRRLSCLFFDGKLDFLLGRAREVSYEALYLIV
jgi:hypothetical protein